MFTKTKTALVVGLLAATSTSAFALNHDPNPANRYPAYADPAGALAPYLGRVLPNVATQDVAVRRDSRRLQSAPVHLGQGRMRANRTGRLRLPAKQVASAN